MQENPQQPLVDRASLEERFGGYQPIPPSESLPNIPFTGLNMQTPSFGGGDREPISAVQALDNAIKPRGDGALRGGSIARSVGELTNPRYNAFVPGDYNNEDAYAQGQSWTEKMANGVGKGLVLTGTTFLQSTVGLANGLANWMATGKFASFYDNDFNKALDNINVELDNNLLPNYYTDAEKNAAWYSPDNLFTANFLWNGVVKNLGFAAGAALSGGVYSAGIKALSSLPGISRLISIGKQAEVVAATEAGIMGAGKAADTYGKIKSLSDRFLSSYNVLSPGGRAVVAGLATTGEAGFEAYQTLNERRNELIEEYTKANDGVLPTGADLEEINRKAEQVGNSAFLANVALLTATNYIQFPKILGSSYTSEKGMINSLIRETKDIVEKQGVYIAKPAVGGKIISTLNKIRPYTFSTSEAFEEGAQFAIGVSVNDYYRKKENNEPTSWIQSLAEGFNQTFTTDEGMENLLIGGLSGAIMQGRGRYAEEKEKSKNTAAAIEAFNKFKLSDFSKETIDSVNRGTVLQQEREQFLKSGDILNSKDKEADYIINYLSPRIKYGRYDLVAADIADYKKLASSDEGFAQLQAEGKALPTDTREAYLQRLNALQATANNVKSLYQSLNLRYGGIVNENGDPIYSSEVMDKMVYAASKIADYDNRIPSISSKLLAAGISVDPIVKDIVEGKVDSFNKAIEEVTKITTLTEDDRTSLGEALEDVAELSVRRHKFLKEYDELKRSPEKYKEETKSTSSEEVEEKVTGEKDENKVTVKTKTGERDYEKGQKYFVGKGVDYETEGLNAPVEVFSLTILGENGDGTLRIRDNKGEERDISKEVLQDYKLTKESALLSNKVAKYFYNHRNEIFQFNFGKQFGGKKRGRLEYDNGKLLFAYLDNKGKIKRKELNITHFTVQEGYKEARIKKVGIIESNEQKQSREEFTSPEEVAKQKETLASNRDKRTKVISELESETRERIEEVNKKIDTKKKELETIQEDLDNLSKDAYVAPPVPRTKKTISLDRVRLKKTISTTSKGLTKLSRMKEDVENEIEKLTTEKNELEFNLSYIEDFGQNLDELPENTGEFLEELKNQIGWIESLILETGSEINSLSKLSNGIDDAIKSFLSLLDSSLKKLQDDYPDYLRSYIERVKDNWIFSEEKILKGYLADLALTQDLEKEISISQEQFDKINSQVENLYKQLGGLEDQYKAKKAILDRFEAVAKAYKAQKSEEAKMFADEQLLASALGTADTSVQTAEFDKEYEPSAKKSDEVIWRATLGIVRGNKPHQVRANTFGFNLNKFPNRKNIRGVYVTSKNENEIIPGLTDLLRINEAGVIDEDINKDEIIALVMVQENEDGKIQLVGEDGQPIPEGTKPLESAIFQVFPDGNLQWGAEFNNESMFRKSTPQEVKDAITKQYKEWRKSVLENPSLSERYEIEASFGRVENVVDADGKIIYDTRTSVQDANLISVDDLESTQLITIPTLPTEGNIAVINQGTVTFKAAVGTPLLETPNGLVKLQNRKHTKKEAEVIYQAILQLAKNMLNPQVGIKDAKSERLLNWLKSTVYWGIPQDQNKKRKPAGYNSVFFEKDTETNRFMLSISGKGKDFVFTPTALEENKDAIVLMLSNMYNNVNNSFAKLLNEPYEEILSISESGEVTSRVWKNYQSYLLSNTTPDGKVRSGEQLPLSTTMRPVANAEDVNRTNIYFYTTDTADDFVIPIVEKKKAVTPKVITPGAPTPTKAAPQAAPTQAPVKKEQPSFKPNPPGEYKFDGTTINTYVSSKNKTIYFRASSKVNDKNFNTEIAIIKGGDSDSIAEELRKLGKDPADQIKRTILKEILPILQSQRTSEDDESFTIGEEEEDEGFTIEEPSVNVPTDVVNDAASKIGSPISQSVLDAINRKISGMSDEALRVILKNELKTFVPENWNQVEAWLKSNFPNIPVYRVKNVIQATNGRQAWGMFKDGAIYIYENAEVGTVYHEVFHAVWRMFADPTEQKAVLDEMRTRSGKFYDRASLKDISYSEATEEQLEEKLAEEFRDYVQFKKIPAKPAKGRPYILKLFADMVTAIKEFFLGPNSDSKVKNMFDKIGQGYYKTHIPFQTNLSFAKEGIIDVEDAFADSDAALSLKNITDKERNDIIQHMTYLTLVDLIKTDESLFNIEKKNKKETYAKLKDQVLETISQKIRTAQLLVDEGEFTQEQVNPLISSTIQLMQSVEDQWDVITERHGEYLKSYQIEFDENDNLVLNDENNSGRGDYQDATKIDNFKKANGAIKLLLATIPQVTEDGKIDPSSIGGAQLLPVGKTYISLMNNLYTSSSIEEMMNRLRKMAVSDANYRALYRRITKRPWKDEGVDLSAIETQHGLQLISSLWNTFKKQNPDVKNVFILENGEVVVGEANLSSAAQQLRSEYLNSIVFKAKEGKGFFVYDDKDKEKVFRGDPNKLKGVMLNSVTGMVDFLNQMGIPFTVSDVNKMNSEQTKMFREAVLGIKESISKTEKIATFSGKALGMSGRLLELGLVKAAVSNPEFSSTYFNVSGERTQSFIGTNAASDLYEFLSKLERFNNSSVGGTRYNYLLTDSFAKYSNLLSRMFTENGVRKQDTQDLFKIGYVGGTVNEEKGKRKESSKLTYKDRLIQEINLNLSGYYLNLVPGDASIEWMIKMGNPISIASINRGMDDINAIFKGYFMAELELVRENRSVAKGRKSNEMRFFNGILGEGLQNNILAAKGTPEEVYNQFASRINDKVSDFMQKDMLKLKTSLRQYGILKDGVLGFEFENINLPKNIDEKEVDRQLIALTANYMIANIEMHKLLYSDPYQYEDELKRIKSFNSPRQAIINNSPKMNTAFDRVWNRGYESGDIGHTKFTRDYFRSATHADVIGIIDLLNYTDFKETDGSGIVSMKANRHFRIRASNWNSDEERQYKYDIAWEKRDKSKNLSDEQIKKAGLKLSKEEMDLLDAGNPGIQSAYTPIKPIVSGSKLSKNGTANSYNDVVLDKFALYPLSYRIMKELNKDANAIKLYDKMQSEDIDYIVFSSGRKVGAESPHQTYKDGVFNNDPYKGVINVPFSIMSIQAEVPSKDTPLVTRGSQITKLITLDFMEAGVPIDFFPDQSFANRYKAWYKITDEDERKQKSELYTEIKNNQDLLDALIEEGYKSTLKRMGIKKTINKDGEKKFEITDISKAGQTLRDEVLKREVNDNISDALSGFLQGKVVLEATPAYQQIRNIIYSIADKEFISPKISGGMKVQIPSTLFESGARKVKDGLYESDVLDFYVKDGKRVAEVMLGRWFDSPLSDEELLEYLNDENNPEGQKILSGVGYRIPTQKQNSVDVVVIKKFLPKEFGDSVVIPAALVQKVGSDFDIDKLSMYLKNVYADAKGNIKLVPFYGYGKDALAKFEQLYADIAEEKIDIIRGKIEKLGDLQNILGNILTGQTSEKFKNKWIPILRNMFGRDMSALDVEEAIMSRLESRGKQLADLDNYELQEILMEEFKERMYRKSLENEYIQSMENLITHPKNYDNLIKPNSADPLKDLSIEIAEKTVGQSFDYKNVKNMLDRTFMSRLRHAFVTGKYAIGIAAVNQTNHSLNQRQPIYIDISKLNLVSEEDRFWLGDATIKFDKYNTIEIDGKVVPTLSMIKNKADEFISDIIGMFIDGYVDISKGPWIMELGATPNVASTWLFLIKLGVPVNTVAYFMNQPIVRDYLRTIESAGYSWLFIDNFVKDMADIYSQDMTETELSNKLATFKIPGEAALKNNVGKRPSELSAQEKMDQYLMLQEFLKYAKMAEQMFHVTQGSNYDTSTFNDPYLVFKKQMQQVKAQNTIISSVDELLENSFIGKLAEKVNDVRDAFAQILKSDSPKVRNVIQKVLLPFVETNDKDFVKMAQKAVSDLFDWAVQTDQQLNTMIKDILVNDGGVGREVTMFVNDIKAKGRSHPLHGNEVIKIIEGIPSIKAAIGGANNVKLNMGENKVYDQNNIIYAFRELREYLKGENNPLYNRLVTLSILQSGLSSSPVSFTSLLPYEDFENIYNKTLSKLEGMSNLDDFYKLGVFQRNNWNNDDVVPYLKAALITTSSGRKHYNPSMKFLPDSVTKAVNSNQIPPILTRSKRNREANSDYIVYTWEKQEELLTKEELNTIATKGGSIYKAIASKKAAMRQAGDYSYINKALFRKVYDNYGKAFEHLDYKGQKYFVYKAINAWGDSFRANEFWATDHKSVLENGFLKVEDVDNNVIISKFLEQGKVKTTPTAPTAQKSVADIPQNKVSGVESFGSLVTAAPEVIKSLGSSPHSIDMIEAGFRTRTTRSANEMADYAIKVGDIVKHFGKSADGTTKTIYAKVTAIHPKGSPGWKGTWTKEGWRAEDVNVIDRYKDGAAAIEFELISPSPTALTTPLTGEYTPQEKKIMETEEFKKFFEQQVPWLSLRQVLDYYKKCKNI